MKEEFLDYVDDIIKAMDDALSFVRGINYDTFIKDRKTMYAAIRALEIIGEARIVDFVLETLIKTKKIIRRIAEMSYGDAIGSNNRQARPHSDTQRNQREILSFREF